MKKSLLIAKANLSQNKKAAIPLFIIIMIVSALITIAGSIMMGMEKDFWAGVERMNSMHNAFVMPRSNFRPSFEDFFKNDPRVSDYEITNPLLAHKVLVNLGSNIELSLIVADIEEPVILSAPFMNEQDDSIPREQAIFLPIILKNYDYQIGSSFKFTYRNIQFEFLIAGFFETTEFASVSYFTHKYYVYNEGFEQLSRYFDRAISLTAHLDDPNESAVLENDFIKYTDLDFTSHENIALSVELSMYTNIFSIYIMAAIVFLFAFILTIISLLVIRFRVSNSIESNMRKIGVLKASGYKSGEIMLSYLAEYLILAAPAAVIGIAAAHPAFIAVRQAMFTVAGYPWTLGVSLSAALAAAVGVTAILLLMVLHSTWRIKKLTPVMTLRGGISVNNFRRNFFPLKKGLGNVHTRLGFKNMLAYSKTYMMIGIVIAGISLAIVAVVLMFQLFVADHMTMVKLVGFEVSDASINVTRHTDAKILANQLELLPEVRKTSMLDQISFKIEDFDVIGQVSNDFSIFESYHAAAGRMPVYDNEVAFPKLFMDRLGKKIGDSVKVTVKNVSQEYIITGQFSTMSNNGQVAAITLEGYQNLDPNYKRVGINVYFNDGVTFMDFCEILKQRFGVLNIYHQEEDNRFSGAKERAEELISRYLELYDINSVEYAVIYEGEIIMSGSSSAYQIEQITDYREWMEVQVGTYSGPIASVALLVAAVSIIITMLILTMTVRSIVAKRRHELGIMKACGYTSKQLARQLAFSFMPVAVVGAIIGSISGSVTFSPLMLLALSQVGIQNANFDINPLLIAALGTAVVFLVYAVANISAMRIKNISVYGLLNG